MAPAGNKSPDRKKKEKKKDDRYRSFPVRLPTEDYRCAPKKKEKKEEKRKMVVC